MVRFVLTVNPRNDFEERVRLVLGENQTSNGIIEYCPNTLPNFTENRIVSCNGNLGNKKKRNFPAKYWVDEHFLVYDIHKNIEIVEEDSLSSLRAFTNKTK